MKLTSTITVANHYGLYFHGETSVWDGPSLPADAPAFIWAGADGGTMFSFDHVSNWVVEGLAFFTSASYAAGTGGASQVFLISQTNNSTSPVTTNISFRRVSINGTQQNPAFAGFTFGAFANVANMEHMEIRDSIITCSYNTSYSTAVGTGISLSFTQNAQKHLYQRNVIRQCSAGVSLGGGSADIVNNEFQSNTTPIVLSQFLSTPILIGSNDVENFSQFITGPTNLATMIIGNRLSAGTPPGGGCLLQFGNSAGPITFAGNNFEQMTVKPLCGPGGGSVATIRTSGNNFGNITVSTLQSGLATFSSAVTDGTDVTASGNNPLIMSGGVSNFIPGAAGWGYLDFKSTDGGTNYYKWVVSENGGPYRTIMRYVGLSSDLPVTACTVNPRDLGEEWIDTTDPNNVILKKCLKESGTLGWSTVAHTP